MSGTSSNMDSSNKPDWRAEFYANQNLIGAPALVRQDPAINFDWGTGSPAPGLPATHFSARWTRELTLEAGTYRFTTLTDDGVRLFVDGQLAIDAWRVMAATTLHADLPLAAGRHDLRMEYFQAEGAAVARLAWSNLSHGNWRGEYFDNINLAGAPRLVRYDADVKFNWGAGSPDPAIPADNFSVRWTRSLALQAGTYQFNLRADDGVRLFVDGNLVIDQWHDATGQTYTATLPLAAGTHSLRLEYYERAGNAFVDLGWQVVVQNLVGNIITCMRPQNSWIKVYRQHADGTWEDMNPHGWGPVSQDGYLKIDGMPVDSYFGPAGNPYRVEMWAGGALVVATGDTAAGQPEYRVRPDQDNYTPWGCPAP